MIECAFCLMTFNADRKVAVGAELPSLSQNFDARSQLMVISHPALTEVIKDVGS